MYMKLLFLLFIPIFIIGCGVSEDIHKETLSKLQAKKADLKKALLETVEANKKIVALQKTMQEKEQLINEISATVSAKKQKIEELSAKMSAALDAKKAALDKALSKTLEANKKIDALQKTMQEKEQLINEISATVSAKKQKINELSAEMFAALDTINAELGKALSQRRVANNKIDALQKSVQEKEQESVEVSVEMSAALDAKNAELDKALSGTVEANKKIDSLQKTMQKKEQVIKVLSSGLSEKVEWFEEFYKRGSAKDARIEELSASVFAKEQRIKYLSAEMSATLDTKNAELDKALSETVEANKEIVALQKMKQEREQLNEVLSSGLSEKVQWISDISAEKDKELVDFKNTYENLVKTLKDEVEKGEIKISRAVDSLLVKIVDKILFASGKATIKKSGQEVLQKIGDILETVKNRQIMIKGHTDNVPIGKNIKEDFPSNWELSAMRAINVVHYLHEKVGISPKALSATGYSKFRPVAANDTPEGRAQNRRIEITLLSMDVDKVLKELKK